MRRPRLVWGLVVAAVFAGGVAVFAVRNSMSGDVDPDDLPQLISRADKIVVREGPWEDSPVLFESAAKGDLNALKNAVRVTRPDGFVHCMCDGTPAIYLYAAGKEIGLLTNHHAYLLRSSLWESDAEIADRETFLRWFDERGIEGPRAEYEESLQRESEFAKARQRWIDAMPAGLRPLWPDLENSWEPDLGPARKAVAATIPDQNERIRSLLNWYGSGQGPWSGFPMYESVAGELLLSYEMKDLLSAIEGKELAEAETEGAARLFATEAGQKGNDALTLLSRDLKRQLLDHSLRYSQEENREWAERVFGHGY